VPLQTWLSRHEHTAASPGYHPAVEVLMRDGMPGLTAERHFV